MTDGPVLRAAPFGRERELAELGSWARGGLAGHGGAVVVSGDAGIGKTTVVGAFVADLAASGVLTTVGHCVNLGGSPMPYLPFVEAFARLRTAVPAEVESLLARQPALGRLVAQGSPTPGDLGDAGGRQELFEAVHVGLEQLAGEHGLLVQLEDVHWADQSSLDLITYLLTRGFGRPVLLVISYRSDDLHRRHPLRPVLSQWSRLAVTRLELHPLSDAAVRDLVHALDRGPVDPTALQGVVTRAEGNAFFAEELASAAAGTPDALPGDLADLLLHRLNELSDPARAVVRAVAVAGRRVRHDVLTAVVDLAPPRFTEPVDGLEQALREAIDANVLRSDGDGYVFRHALLAEAVDTDLLPGERARLHAAYVQVLRDHDVGAASDLARHALAAGDDTTALHASVRAAQNALAVGGPDEALAHYEVALELLGRPTGPALGGDDGPDEIDLVLQASTAAAAAGVPHRAMALVRDRLDRRPDDTPPLTRARLLEALASAANLTDYDDPLGYATEALALVPAEPSALRARVLRSYAGALAGHGRDTEALRWAEEAHRLALDLGLAPLAAETATVIARLQDWFGDWRGSTAGLRAVVAEARMRDDPAELRARYLLGILSYERGDLADAAISFQAAADRARQLGRPWAPYGTDGRAMVAVVRFVQGEWDEVLAVTSTDGEAAPGLATAMLRAVGMSVRAGRGDPAAFDDLPVVKEWRRGDGMIAVLAAVAAIDAYAGVGDLAGAIAAHDEAAAFLVETWFDPDFAARIQFGGLLVGQLASAAQRPDADRSGLVERAEALVAAGQQAYDVAEARRPNGPESRAWLARLDAEARRLRWLARVEPPDDALVQAWRTTVELFGTFPHRFERARSEARLAAALRAVGAVAEAKTYATSARDTARALGARPLLAEIDALGLTAGPDVLTPREAEVLALVAEGHSNAEIGRQLFISAKTASVHVSNILAKLGADGRTEAVTVARRRGLLE